MVGCWFEWFWVFWLFGFGLTCLGFVWFMVLDLVCYRFFTEVVGFGCLGVVVLICFVKLVWFG